MDEVSDNLSVGSPFGPRLVAALGADETTIATAISSAWSTSGLSFLKLYSIGVGKFLLQFFHGQPNLPANVELASCYAYRVHDTGEPDMLALAFRVIPEPLRVYQPNVGGAAIVPELEPGRGARVVSQAQKLQDLDQAIANDETIFAEAVSGTISLLQSAHYDIVKWKSWLATHPRRPLNVA